MRTKTQLEPAVGRKFLYPVVIGVRHVKIILVIDGDTRRRIELPFLSPLGTKLGQEPAGGVKNGDAVQVFIANVNPALAIDCDPRRRCELAVSFSKRAEGTEVFALRVAHGDPDASSHELLGAVHHIQQAILANGTIDGNVATPALHGRNAHR